MASNLYHKFRNFPFSSQLMLGKTRTLDSIATRYNTACKFCMLENTIKNLRCISNHMLNTNAIMRTKDFSLTFFFFGAVRISAIIAYRKIRI